MKLVSLFMDVEDPINPLADDAALDFPLLFQSVGVRGSFCLTGEKCRKLRVRSRVDVAEAYKPHSLGLHTNTHSFHPSTMELLADKEWDEGCLAAYEVEKSGFDAFVELIGRPPSFWGGGGNTWSPEVTDTMKRLGIPAYVYSLTQFPNDPVHRFNGVFGLPQALSISETEWADNEKSTAASERVLNAIEAFPQPWIGVFVGHPTKFRYTDWWDTPYYAGRTPNSPEYGTPVSEECYDRSRSNLSAFLAAVQSRFQVIGVEDAINLPWNFRSPLDSELAYFEEHTSAALRAAKNWPIHVKSLDPELIVSKTMALAGTAQIGDLVSS